MHRKMTNRFAFLAGALAILSLVGCSPDEQKAAENAFTYSYPPELEAPAVTFYLEGSRRQDPYGDHLGCGVLACAWVNNEMRYFVVTAAHVLQNARGSLQIGLRAATAANNIRRLHIPPGGIEWKQPDIENDIIIGDITKSMEVMQGIGTSIECIDLDSVDANSLVSAKYASSDIGVVTSNRYERLSISPFAHATAVCADVGSTMLVNATTAEWSSPFVKKEATLLATFVRKRHAVLDKNDNPVSEPLTLTVNNYLGGISPGNSGAPVYIRGIDGREYFAGIINGRTEREFYAVPVDFIKDYVNKTYGGKENTASVRYKSVYFAEYEAKENAVKDVPVTLWRPGARKLDITLEGDATAKNAFMLMLGDNKSFQKLEQLEADCFRIGWDNRKSQETTTGHKSLTISFYYDSEGKPVHGDVDDVEKVTVENCGMPLNKDFNIMRIASLGKGDVNGKVRIELFTLENGDSL